MIASTPSRCRLFSLLYLSLCFLSLCASSSCRFPSQPAFSPFSCFLHSPFSSPPFDPCLFLDLVPACLTIPPALTMSLSATLYLLASDLVLTLLPVHDHSLAYPFGLINIVRLQRSASCVCIWVSPCALIVRTGHDRPSRLEPSPPCREPPLGGMRSCYRAFWKSSGP